MNIDSNKINRASIFALAVCLATALSGCGGTKLLKEQKSMEVTTSIATTNSDELFGSLDWVIVRDGPGTWAKNADWDEYLVTIVNETDTEVHISGVTVVDLLGNRLEPESQRKSLVKGTKRTAKRYKDEHIEVKAGVGTGTLIAAGAAVGVVGTAVAVGAAQAAVLTGASTAGGAAAAAGGVVLLAPVLVVGGIVRGVNNSKVGKRIESRHTAMPAAVEADGIRQLDLFFPLAPSPQRVEIAYVSASGEGVLIIETTQALNGLHLVPGTL